MVYVGIDIAKLNHYASVISSDGEVLLEPFKFSNDNDGFCTLVSKLNQFDKDKVIIGLEPRLTIYKPDRNFVHSQSNTRKMRTDKVDASIIICKTLLIMLL